MVCMVTDIDDNVCLITKTTGTGTDGSASLPVNRTSPCQVPCRSGKGTSHPCRAGILHSEASSRTFIMAASGPRRLQQTENRGFRERPRLDHVHGYLPARSEGAHSRQAGTGARCGSSVAAALL